MHAYYILERNMGRNTNSANVFMIIVTMMFSWSLEKGIAIYDETDYHTLPLTSMLPPFACNPSTSTGPSRKASMKVVHRFGPCSTRGKDSPTMSELLRYDESRFNSIQARIKSLNQKPNDNSIDESSKAAKLPATHADPGIAGNYVVTVGLGTPENKLDLVIDTGSEITWTQCTPCRRCYEQRAPIFNPKNSRTYSNVAYNSSTCSGLLSATSKPPKNSSENTCMYEVRYNDGSYSIGDFAKDKLTLKTSTDVLDNFFFGCGQNNSLSSSGPAGIMGLGKDPLSIVSQTSQKYGKYFSYCLPTLQSNNGYLTFGESSSNGVRFTPLVTSQYNYYIDILSISVNNKKLPVNIPTAPKTLIDSGSVVTRLPPTAYAALRDAFREEMKKEKYPLLPSNTTGGYLDTCYDFTKFPNPKIPVITFTFGGNVNVNLNPKGVMLPLDGQSIVCLVFRGNNKASDVSVFGSYQQQTFEVVYDVPGNRIGFAAGGCS